MTNEEALYYFRQLMNRSDGVQLFKPEGGIAVGAKEEMFGTVISALEKQIPKKPIKTDMLISGCFRAYACPVCDQLIIYGEGCKNNKCRQAIDWSESEES